MAYTGSRNGFGASSCLEDPDTEALQLSEAYVHSLASLGLERLQNEPGRLRSEAMAVDEVLVAVVAKNWMREFCVFVLTLTSAVQRSLLRSGVVLKAMRVDDLCLLKQICPLNP